MAVLISFIKFNKNRVIYLGNTKSMLLILFIIFMNAEKRLMHEKKISRDQAKVFILDYLNTNISYNDI